MLGLELEERGPETGSRAGRPSSAALRLGVHERGKGPGDTVSLPYLAVDDMSTALERVIELGGEIIHPGDRWSICRDSEGSPFALSA